MVGLRRGRRRPAQTATSLFVVTSTMPSDLPPCFRPTAEAGESCRSHWRRLCEAIKRTLDSSTATIQYVRVDHRGLDVLVTQKFLDGSNVVTVLQQMRRKRMPKGVGGHVLWQTRPIGCLMDAISTAAEPRRLARFVASRCWRHSCGPSSGFGLESRLPAN